MPIEGVLNKDYFFINHLDLDTAKGKIKDYNCGWHTYDGHQGNDIVLKSFRAMDSGVYILAVAKGKVVTLNQKKYDRNKKRDVPLGFGNWIAIDHGNQVFTYYAHIRKNSAVVKLNDSVKAGQRLALVGSAGNSSDPHLHFEMYNGFDLVDPFKGPCQRLNPAWKTQPLYDTVFKFLTDGLIPFQATYDTIREYLPTPTKIDTGNKFLTYWVHTIESRINDSNSFVWYTPKKSVWFQYSYKNTDNARYAHFWTYIYTPKDTGWWQVKYFKNGTVIKTRDFHVGDFVTGIEKVNPIAQTLTSLKVSYFDGGNFQISAENKNIQKVEIFNLEGKKLFESNQSNFQFNGLPKGMQTIFLKVYSGNDILNRKILIQG